jgi:hypothetical protein
LVEPGECGSKVCRGHRFLSGNGEFCVGCGALSTFRIFLFFSHLNEKAFFRPQVIFFSARLFLEAEERLSCIPSRSYMIKYYTNLQMSFSEKLFNAKSGCFFANI